ncbi:MAG: hypothetical protein AVO38_01225 [delta proteobacterium ML8_D]|nr:MAG: hypothetical protein AVO38_01225 [delta proteobacterium ML8_D]
MTAASATTPLSNSQYTNSCSPGNPYTFFKVNYVWNASDWNISVVIKSFGDDLAAGTCFGNRLPTSETHAIYEVLEQEVNYILYYKQGYRDTDNQEMLVEDMTLLAVHEGSLVTISGWTQHWAYNDPEYMNRGKSLELVKSYYEQLFEKAKMLINAKCGRGIHPPEITFYPYTEGTRLFELNILKDKGFLIEINDEDGVKDSGGNWLIDLNTLKILLNGHDITGHFLQTVTDQGLLAKASVLPDGKTFQVMIKLDPEKLMAEHNLFALSENGEVAITLSICDVDGICGSKEHKVYFGPFSVFSKAQGRDLGNAGAIDIYDWKFGNTGRECQAEIYLAVWNETSGKIWFHYYVGPESESYWGLYENEIKT